MGCGEGNGLYFLRELRPGARLTGLDFSPQKIAFLSSVLPEVEARLGDAAELPFAAGLFDLVLCRDLLHHLPHARERVVSEALRVAKPGGTVVVVESDGRRLLNRLFSLLIPAERGLLASRPELLLALAKPHGEAELQYVEASFMIRALAFFLGWPKKPLSLPVSLLYRAAGLWEALVEKSVPKSRWSYMMLVLSKGR